VGPLLPGTHRKWSLYYGCWWARLWRSVSQRRRGTCRGGLRRGRRLLRPAERLPPLPWSAAPKREVPRSEVPISAMWLVGLKYSECATLPHALCQVG